MSLAMRAVKHRKAYGSAYGQQGPFILPRSPNGITRYTGPVMYNRARQGQAGGIFGTIGNILGTVGKVASFIPGVGGIASGALGTIGGAIGSLDKKSKTAGPAGPSTGGLNVASLPISGPGFGSMPVLNMMPTGTGVVPVSSGSSDPMLGTVAKQGGGGCAPSGYHWNKSGYWSNESDLLPGASWTPPGTKLVKNRKRNPYNPKAASRAMSRLSALSQGMKSLERQLSKLAPRKRTCSHRAPSRKK